MSERLFMGSTLVILILFSCTSAFAQSVCPFEWDIQQQVSVRDSSGL
jgi:hypothetical protein